MTVSKDNMGDTHYSNLMYLFSLCASDVFRETVSHLDPVRPEVHLLSGLVVFWCASV